MGDHTVCVPLLFVLVSGAVCACSQTSQSSSNKISQEQYSQLEGKRVLVKLDDEAPQRDMCKTVIQRYAASLPPALSCLITKGMPSCRIIKSKGDAQKQDCKRFATAIGADGATLLQECYSLITESRKKELPNKGTRPVNLGPKLQFEEGDEGGLFDPAPAADTYSSTTVNSEQNWEDETGPVDFSRFFYPQTTQGWPVSRKAVQTRPTVRPSVQPETLPQSSSQSGQIEESCPYGRTSSYNSPGRSACVDKPQKDSGPVFEKPVIYLYPTQAGDALVNLEFAGKLTASYPEYQQNIRGWKVMAKPDGTLQTMDKKEYPYLFWEGIPQQQAPFNPKLGFVVSSKNIRSFLEAKLDEMGLNARESADFVTYWYPRLQKNAFTHIYFAGTDYEKNAVLNITPKPDSVLRVFMLAKAVDEMKSVQPQKFKKFVRKGFAVVEWGGAEIR